MDMSVRRETDMCDSMAAKDSGPETTTDAVFWTAQRHTISPFLQKEASAYHYIF